MAEVPAAILHEGAAVIGPGEGLWNALDVAAFLKVSRSWVYMHAEDGTLPSVRIGGLRRFVPSQIRAFATGHATPQAPVTHFPRKDR
jgi:excisionase family DNA binding protein